MDSFENVLFVDVSEESKRQIKENLSDTKFCAINFDSIEEARDFVATSSNDMIAVVLNLTPKHIPGVGNMSGYIKDISALVQDSLDSSLSVVMTTSSEKRHSVATVFGELETKEGEDFRVIEELETGDVLGLLENIIKTRQQNGSILETVS